MSAEIISFPSWMAEGEPRFRAFDDGVTGEIIILPVVRIERQVDADAARGPRRRRALSENQK